MFQRFSSRFLGSYAITGQSRAETPEAIPFEQYRGFYAFVLSPKGLSGVIMETIDNK